MARFDGKQVVQKGHPLQSKDALQYVRQIKQVAEDNGIVCNQSHAPFPVYCPEIRDLMETAIEFTAEAGGEICVIHPMNNGTPEENAEMYFELLPFAKNHGVKIATENMWNWNADKTQSVFAACATSDSFSAHLDAVNDDFFVACLDIGHAEMRGSGSGAVDMIHALGNRLQAVHMHDNDLLLDSHQLPFTMRIDFLAVTKALREVCYQGDMTLEANSFLKTHYPDDVFEGMKVMADTAKRLVRLFEEKV
jgi:sugar phosphate isomerase/epimerase